MERKQVVVWALLFSMIPIPAQARWYCPEYIVNKLFPADDSGRLEQQVLISTSIAIGKQTSWFQGTSGRQLSATSAALTDISDIIDMYLGMGAVGPLVDRYGEMVRAAEYTFLQHKQNLKILDVLESQLTANKGAVEISKETRKQIMADWKSYKAKSGDLASMLSTMSPVEMKPWLAELLKMKEILERNQDADHISLADRRALLACWKNLKVDTSDLKHDIVVMPVQQIKGWLQEVQAIIPRIQQICEGADITPEARGGLFAEWKKFKLNASDLEDRLEKMSPKEVIAWLKKKVDTLKKENSKHEWTMGKSFLEWRQVRQHLNELIFNGDRFMLEHLIATDGRHADVPVGTKLMAAQRGLVGKVEPGAEALELPQAPREESPRVKKSNHVKSELVRLDDRIGEISVFIGATENYDAFEFDKLETFLKDNGYGNDSFAAIAARGKANKKAEGDKEKLSAELRLLRQRLRDIKTLMDEAYKLDNVLGLVNGDFAITPEVLPEDRERPTIEEFSAVVYRSKLAQQARQRRERIRAVLNWVDGNLAYGKVGGMIPKTGQLLDAVGAPGLRTFVYALFEDLYHQHARRNYFPAITILRRSRGDAQKLRSDLEKLNGGTHDEMLLVFARRGDLTGLWELIKEEAGKNKDNDSKKLYYRMVAAEKKVVGERKEVKTGEGDHVQTDVSYSGGMGTISLIDGSSYTRYFVAAAINGGLIMFGKWLFSQQQVKPKTWQDKFLGLFIKEALAAERNGRLWSADPDDWTDEVEEYALANLEVVVYGMQGILDVPPGGIEQAARNLMLLEMNLTNRSAAEVIAVGRQ